MSDPAVHPTRSPARRGPSRKRRLWEERYRERDASSFSWFRPDPPPELVELLEARAAPAGAALDLGCGPGTVTAVLAERFRPAIGMDLAFGAVAEARRASGEGAASPAFLVAEAPAFPFRSESFALVFDRGCLQAIPRARWRTYFREVERLLVPGGLLQLYCSAVTDGGGTAIRRAMSRLRRLRAPLPISLADGRLSTTLGEMLPSSMRPLDLRDQWFRTPAGRSRVLTYGLFRKD